MTAIADQLMIRYMDPANVDLLLVPLADATKQRAQALLASSYGPRLLTVQSLDSISSSPGELARSPVVEPTTVNGTWEKVLPQSERSLISFDLPAIDQTGWIDMALETTVSVRVSATSAPLNMVASTDVSELSQQDFLAKFQFLDLSGLMATARVSTYQELQADFPRLYRLHYATPAPYNPDDPAARRSYKLRIAVLYSSRAWICKRPCARWRRPGRAVDAVWPQPSEYEGGDLLCIECLDWRVPDQRVCSWFDADHPAGGFCLVRRPELGRGVRGPVMPGKSRKGGPAHG